MAITKFCTEVEVEDRLSEEGVDLRIDDTPVNVERALEDAGEEILTHCGHRYDETQLLASDIVTKWAIDIAAYYYCIRRGNGAPGSVVDVYLATIEKLKLILSGARNIYGIAPHRLPFPRMANRSIRMRPRMHPRVQEKSSVGKREGSQRKDGLDPMEYLGDYVI